MSISFVDDMIKLSVKKTKWTGLLARTRARKGDFRETGPRLNAAIHMHEPNSITVLRFHATHPEFSYLIQSGRHTNHNRKNAVNELGSANLKYANGV